MWSHFTIQFQTAPHTPPPYCYQCIVLVHFLTNKLSVQVRLHYFSRASLTEEEIIAEGFSIEDDFDWEGTLPNTWVKALQNLLQQTTWVDSPQGQDYLAVITDEKETLFPREVTTWEMTFQALLQAAHELNESGGLTEIQFLAVFNNSKKQHIILRPRFSTREVTILMASNTTKKKVAWSTFHQLMVELHTLTLQEEQASTKPPRREGYYINHGDGYWYLLGRKAGTSAINRVKRLFNEIELIK
ncbi:MAG: hypothetical protein ACFB0B_10295 [Thermonemataceae bacterium]